MVVDPVSGMTIDENTSQFKSKMNGDGVRFYCISCKAIFVKNPSKYKVV